MEKTQNKPSRGTVIFYSIYTAVTLILLTAVAVVLIKLNTAMKNYETSLPKYKAEEVFTMLYSDKKFDSLYDKISDEISTFETKEQFVKYMSETVGDKQLSYREVSAGLGDKKRYAVKAGDTKISEFFLVRFDNIEKGESPWMLDSVICDPKKNENVSVKILDGSKLYLNGIEVDQSHIKESNITTDSCKHMPDGVNGITYNLYTVEDLMLKPDVKITDAHGNEKTPVYDEEGKMYVEEIPYSTPPTEIYNRVEEAVQTYAKYMTLDSSLAKVKQYFDASSHTYTYIRTSDTWCYTPHIGFEFKDIELSEYYKYDENTFSARYKCNHHVYRTKTDTFLFPLDLTLYFKNIGGTFYCYDMVTNG